MIELLEKYNFEKTSTNEYIFKVLYNYFGKEFERILENIEDSRFKEKFLNNLEVVVSSIQEYRLSYKEVIVLKNLLIYSPFLTGIIKKNPDYFLNYLFKNDNYKKIFTLKDFKESIIKFHK